MSEQLNPRTARVRESLVSAAWELVSQRPVADISLTEIAELAQVSRPTVYKQFNDTASLVAEAAIAFMEDSFARFDAELEGQPRDSVDYLEKLMDLFVAAVYENRAFCRNAMHGPSCAAITVYVIGMLDKRMERGLVGRRLAPAGAQAADYRNAISAGVVWLLIQWLDSSFEGEDAPGRFARRLTAVLAELSEAGAR